MTLQMSLPPAQLQAYVLDLVRLNFPDGYQVPYPLAPLCEKALARLEHCFSHIHRKYYHEEGKHGVVLFDHLNGDHFASYLYFLANTVWRESGDRELPTRLSYLNKRMHGLDLFYSVTMPNIFLLVHPLGTVIGNAAFQDYLVVYQNVTIGADEAGIYPVFGKGAVLYARSAVIGACRLGDDVVLGANAFILNAEIPANSVVVGQHPAPRIHSAAQCVASRVFRCTLGCADTAALTN
jgi:serine O-acetyltransferase